MSLRLVARPQAEGDYAVGIRSTFFGDHPAGIKGDMHVAPRYPVAAVQARVAGTVYLLLRIDRSGKVSDAFAQQVNLAVIASDTVLKRWRKLFAQSCLEAARQWTFNPATADDATAYRVVRVPVAFHLHEWGRAAPDTYGQWETYVPGPVEIAPWFDPTQMLGDGVDALPGDGGIYGKPSLSLRTPPDQS